MGRHVFDILYCSKAYFYDINNPVYGLRAAIEKEGINAYEDDLDIRRLEHYFRQLYGIFKYIDETRVIDFNDKCRYATIVCSNLSQYELAFLFYQGLSKGYAEFKKLIEKYGLLRDLQIDILATNRERVLYKSKSTMGYNDDSVISNQEYRKEAFIMVEDKSHL